MRNETDESNIEEFHDDEARKESNWTAWMAEFSRSWLSLALSLVVLLVALATQQATTVTNPTASREANVPTEVKRYFTYDSLGEKPELLFAPIYQLQSTGPDSSILLNSTLLDAYKTDGVICIRGLLSDALLTRVDVDTATILQERVAKKQSQFHTVEHSAMFRNISSRAKEVQDFPPLLQVALFSNISMVAAELLGLVEMPQNLDDRSSKKKLRVIRDIFLAKDQEEYTCGWHVDDMGFWPATPNSQGVNAWVALDDMELTEETGGFALAVASHTAPWRTAAYYWTGASTNFPKGGYRDVADMFQRRTGHGTCNLKTSAPHIHQRMEETARIYPVRKGDVVFHTRWLFHKTVPVQRKTDTNRVFRRYSIRYGEGEDTILPPGYGMEPSILWEPTNGGKSANEVCETDGPWYPIAWPRIEYLPGFAKDLAAFCENKLPVALERRKDRIQEMKPFLRQLAKKERSRGSRS